MARLDQGAKQEKLTLHTMPRQYEEVKSMTHDIAWAARHTAISYVKIHSYLD